MNGHIYEVISENEEQCIRILDQKDFDGNGTLDTLLLHSGCGGNCCPNGYSVVFFDGDGYFQKSEIFGYSWSDPIVEKWKGDWTVVLVTSDQGVGNTSLNDTLNRYIFDDGKAIQVSQSKKMQLEAVAELRSSEFDPEITGQVKSIKYDLNMDGKKDTIKALYWHRWGSIQWYIVFENGKEYSNNRACKRVGVLKSSTKGMHDIVCNESSILKWNGSKYIENESNELG